MSIADRLTELANAKNNMKAALESKGVSPTGGLSTYADAIRSIETGDIIIDGEFAVVNGMKFGYSQLTSFSHLDFSKVTDMYNMFRSCSKLIESPNITSSPVDCDNTFYGCTNLKKVNQFDTTKCGSFQNMFYGCTNLTEIPTIVIGTVYSDNNGCLMSGTFYDCKSLTAIEFEYINGVKDTHLSETFYGCSNLTTLGLIKVKNFSDYRSFYGCSKLTNFAGIEGLDYDLDLSWSPLLTVQSLENIINNMDYARTTSTTLKLHPDAAARLTDKLINSATNKGWTITT